MIQTNWYDFCGHSIEARLLSLLTVLRIGQEHRQATATPKHGCQNHRRGAQLCSETACAGARSLQGRALENTIF